MQQDIMHLESGDIIVEAIAKKTPVVFSHTTNQEVYKTFSEDSSCISLPVLDWSNRPLGLINRAKFLGQISKTYFKEIYFDKVCTVFMDSSPVTLETRTPIQDCAFVASDAGEKAITDGIILTKRGVFHGMGYVQDILKVMAEIHQETSRKIEAQRNNLEDLVRERTKALLAAKEEAEQGGRAKSLFLSNMSHEIRTPITAIIGMAQIMAREGVEGDQSIRLDKINNAASHLLGIVNDILDFSKINAGELSLGNDLIDIDQLLREVVFMMEDLAKNKGLELKVFHRLKNTVLLGDAIRLKQAIINYVSNAIKFTSCGSVTIGCREVFNDSANVQIEFEVVDTGPGISSAVLETLFSPFQQGDLSATKRYGGTGLGLVITKQLAKLMGGDAGAESTIGAGSRFWFSASFARASSGYLDTLARESQKSGQYIERKIPHIQNNQGNGWTALVVDDEPINREVIEYFLNEWGIKFDAVSNGLEALRAIEDKRYDIVVMDIQMPVLDGLSATKRIRQRWSDRDIYIIAMSANAFGEDRDKCFEAGADEFIAKPFFPEELQTVLFQNFASLVVLPRGEQELRNNICFQAAPVRGFEAGQNYLMV